MIFVSRRGSLRSVLAEACLAHLSPKRFVAFSCGQPEHLADSVHPAAIGALASASIPPPARLRPRSWRQLAQASSPRADFVVSLDEATLGLQPRWPGQPDSALWVFPDAAALSDAEQVAHSAIQILFALRRRLELLINLPLDGADRAAIRSDVRDLGHMR
ncbi:low molecular weight phosphatase family protein [Variovorax sp. GT1P44]|uniref:arsenate-mycothiol transferase ArsC n=1 Tax=Variovorax sp. GT1P44 TaxID=3443742 RepID=UPI003F489861